MLVLEGIEESDYDEGFDQDVETVIDDDLAVKRYTFAAFLKEHDMQVGFMNELNILRLAKKNELKNLASLTYIAMGIDFVVLAMPVYEMTLREYLRKHRESRSLNRILLQVCEGLKQLWDCNYVHRDLKPENIMLNLKPLQVRLIDFNRSQLRTVQTMGNLRGTEGYFPDVSYLRDGSTIWDRYALAAIILECDMERDGYLGVNTEKETRFVVNKYMQNPECCEHIKHIVKQTLLCGSFHDVMSMEAMMEDLSKAKFRKDPRFR